jgi:hypothetical protein
MMHGTFISSILLRLVLILTCLLISVSKCDKLPRGQQQQTPNIENHNVDHRPVFIKQPSREHDNHGDFENDGHEGHGSQDPGPGQQRGAGDNGEASKQQLVLPNPIHCLHSE